MNTPETPVSPLTIICHICTFLLTYAYIKEELTFPFIYVLLPSLFILGLQLYSYGKGATGIGRGKYVMMGVLMLVFVLTLGQAIKNEGGMEG